MVGCKVVLNCHDVICLTVVCKPMKANVHLAHLQALPDRLRLLLAKEPNIS